MYSYESNLFIHFGYRYMKILKGYVKNQARPEGCIAERYVAEECMKYCSGYIKDALQIGERKNRNEVEQNDFILEGRPISKGKPTTVDEEVINAAHRYVLFNTEEVEPYIE